MVGRTSSSAFNLRCPESLHPSLPLQTSELTPQPKLPLQSTSAVRRLLTSLFLPVRFLPNTLAATLIKSLTTSKVFFPQTPFNLLPIYSPALMPLALTYHRSWRESVNPSLCSSPGFWVCALLSSTCQATIIRI